MLSAQEYRVAALRSTLYRIETDLYGNHAKRQIGEKTKPTMDAERLGNALLQAGAPWVEGSPLTE